MLELDENGNEIKKEDKPTTPPKEEEKIETEIKVEEGP